MTPDKVVLKISHNRGLIFLAIDFDKEKVAFKFPRCGDVRDEISKEIACKILNSREDKIIFYKQVSLDDLKLKKSEYQF